VNTTCQSTSGVTVDCGCGRWGSIAYRVGFLTFQRGISRKRHDVSVAMTKYVCEMMTEQKALTIVERA
jgi:hypothetical protein